MWKNIFWGAGKIGQDVLDFWKRHQISPNFFGDNNKKLWGKEIGKVKVLSPQEIYSLKDIKIFITCQFYDEILNQLLDNGIPKENIVRADAVYRPEMLVEIGNALNIEAGKNTNFTSQKGCLIDLSKGMVLGGVEKWSYATAKRLKSAGYQGAYLLPGNYQNTVVDDTLPAIIINADEKYMFDQYIKNILQSGYKNIICNFPHMFFQAACMIKKKKLAEPRIIAVIHNDEDIYYETYSAWSKYIDVCLVISSKMQDTLLERGFPSEKIKQLCWNIPCESVIKRNYSVDGEPIRIGYAGRVTKIQKRVDLIVDVAEKLKEKEIDFKIQIAGIGDYTETIRKEIAKRGLDEKVCLKGLVEDKDIWKFWSKQDIFLNCSEWEGHSISQCEAMAAGVVPVVTKTSGTEDDIVDGYNGYLADLHDTDTMADRIGVLYKNRRKLEIMGSRCQNIMIERNQSVDEIAYWRELLT